MLLPGTSPSELSNPTESYKLGWNDAKEARWGSLGIAKCFQGVVFPKYLANCYYTGDEEVRVWTKEGSFLFKFFSFSNLSNRNAALLGEEARSRAARWPYLSHGQ